MSSQDTLDRRGDQAPSDAPHGSGSFGQFLAENKLWWILPIVLVLAAVIFVLATSDPAGKPGEDQPFEYDLF